MSSDFPSSQCVFYDGNWLSQRLFVAGAEVSAQFVRGFLRAGGCSTHPHAIRHRERRCLPDPLDVVSLIITGE